MSIQIFSPSNQGMANICEPDTAGNTNAVTQPFSGQTITAGNSSVTSTAVAAINANAPNPNTGLFFIHGSFAALAGMGAVLNNPS